MIIDTHTRFWHSVDQLGAQISAQLRRRFVDQPERLEAGDQAHREAMGLVRVALVHGCRSRHLKADVPLRMISQFVATAPNRLIGVAGIDPLEPGYLDQIEEARALNLSAVVISPADQGFHPCHSRSMALFEKCQRLGWPVFVHQGYFVRDAMLEYAQPLLLDEVARSFPKLRLVLTHLGHPFIDQSLALLSKHQNVFAEISHLAMHPWQLYNALLQAHHTSAIDQILFGSGFPENRPEQVTEAIYSIVRFCQGNLLPLVPREKLRGIVERDSLKLLGLRLPATAENALQEKTASEPA